MSDINDLTLRELKLTAILYARHGAAKHLQETGKLPDRVGGPWSVIPTRLILEERGTDPTLTPDEQLVYDAILREQRLPGGAIRLTGNSNDQEPTPPDGSEATEESIYEALIAMLHRGTKESWVFIEEPNTVKIRADRKRPHAGDGRPLCCPDRRRGRPCIRILQKPRRELSARVQRAQLENGKNSAWRDVLP